MSEESQELQQEEKPVSQLLNERIDFEREQQKKIDELNQTVDELKTALKELTEKALQQNGVEEENKNDSYQEFISEASKKQIALRKTLG